MRHKSDTNRLTLIAPDTWTIRAPAKLNLGLRIFPARPDGFHDLETWMVSLSWHDTLTFSPSAPGSAGGANPLDSAENTSPLSLHITGRSAGIPTELSKNLVGRAALALAAAAGIEPRGRITLHKILPPGGGIGGGSSDAANALLALNQAWNLHWEAARLEAIAAQLGSDIPFFICNTPSLCTGRGEIMTPLPMAYPLFALLLIPPQGCPTKEVYQAFDAGGGGQHKPPREKTDWPRLAAATADEISRLLVNDLEPAAFSIAPWLRDLRDRAARLADRPIHMTGSGSTLFALCGSSAAVSALQAQLESALADACVCIPVAISR